MGQQQLLLLVLSTVIVGLATVAGIQAFEQGSTRANQDALTNTAVKIGSDIQARIEEPSQFGGYDGNISSGTPQAVGNITLNEMGYTVNTNNVYETADGDCEIHTGASTSSSLTADQVTLPGDPIEVLCQSEDNEVVVGVSGTNSDDLTTNSASDSETDLSS